MKKMIKKMISVLLCTVLLGTSMFCSIGEGKIVKASSEEEYVIQFTKQELKQNVSATHTYADSQYNNCAASAAEIAIKKGHAYIFSFDIPEDGTYQIGKQVWGTSLIKFNNTDLSGHKVEFCVTNQDGKILYPTNGEVIVMDEKTPSHTIVDTVLDVNAGDTINYVLYSASEINSIFPQIFSVYNSESYVNKYVTNWRLYPMDMEGAWNEYTTLYYATDYRKVPETPSALVDKKILFAGDNLGIGWAKNIADDCGANVTIATQEGATLSNIREEEGKVAIVNQLHANKSKNFDYVVLQGGFFDAKGIDGENSKESVPPVGVKSKNFDISSFDTSTFAGALEELLYYAREYYPDAGIGFVITYATPNSTHGGYTADENAMREYWDMAKEICDKWNIQYLDLFDGASVEGCSYSYDILKVNTAASFENEQEQVKLNAIGNNLVSPYIAHWIATELIDTNEVQSLKWFSALLTLDFEEAYYDVNNKEYYSSNAENWSSENGRGSHAEMVVETDGNHAVRLTYDTQNNNENYNANAVMNIYDPKTKSKFVGTEGITYTITFHYKVEETDGKELQLFIAPSNREKGYPFANINAFQNTDMGPMAVVANVASTFTAATDIITEKTNEWVTVSVDYTIPEASNGYAVYPIILLQTNGKTKDTTHTGDRNYASVLIDNLIVSSEAEAVELDFEKECLNEDDTKYYGNAINEASDSARGSHAEVITESDGNKAMRLTYDNQNNNYKDNAAFNIYNSKTKKKFVGNAGQKYMISFDYKIECTDDKELQFFIASCGRSYLKWSDLAENSTAMATQNYKFTPATDILTQTTEGYVTVTVPFVSNGTDYPIILLSTNKSVKDTTHTGTRAYASVLVDNVKIYDNQQAFIPCIDYDGNDKTLLIYRDTMFADLDMPSRQGYIFDGWYTDENLTKEAKDGEYVGNYNCIYAKWVGDGVSVTQNGITDYFTVNTDSVKSLTLSTLDASKLGEDISYIQNSMLDVAGGTSVSNFYGSYVFSSDKMIENKGEKIIFKNINFTGPKADTVMFYVELPDYKTTGAEWGLALGEQGLGIRQNGKTIYVNIEAENLLFEYSTNRQWKSSTISDSGNFEGLPSGYKGYIRINLSTLAYDDVVNFNSAYVFDSIEFKMNAIGPESGNLIFGGLLYFPNELNDSTVMRFNNLYYELSKGDSGMDIHSYDAYSDNGSSFDTRYMGTSAKPNVKYKDTQTSAFWGTKPAAITTISGKAETTIGYMTTYINSDIKILMQPGVDTLMFYVEMPQFTQSSVNAGLQMLDLTLKQGENVHALSFSNSIYRYASVYGESWEMARAGADGELYDIPSGFKGYVKIDIKQFKNILEIAETIDFSRLYQITKFELGFNHVGGENGDLIIGAVYSVINDSDVPFIKHGISGESFCIKALPGDFNCNGTYDQEEDKLIRCALVGKENNFSMAAKLRQNGVESTSLIRAKKVKAGVAKIEFSIRASGGVANKNIFTPNVSSNYSPKIYDIKPVTNYVAKIEADTTLNQDPKALAFAQEIAQNKVGDFEKTGIDKMCHVSTFVYAKGNIYMSYYANTISAHENPDYQVARLAYAPENEPSNKVIIDIMQVGDDLNGRKVTGVYDTILMQKEDEPDNLYILWTASINQEYYRLYRIFNMETGELGAVGVNRFKVGDVVNDYSTSGMTDALTANQIGYKEFFVDIGIMQKLSSRVENGERYYYTGSYSGNFTCIIKSKDLITWEYVAQPNEGANNTGFENSTLWENAVYVLEDKVYYFVRQWEPGRMPAYGYDEDRGYPEDLGTLYGILTYYDLNTGEWAKPVLVGDCQSRSDFIYYKGNLYLFYAPTDRGHIGILKIDTENLADTEVVLQAQMWESCFYPFVQYNSSGELCMSYTVDRKHMRLASFTLSDYLD